MKNSILTRLPLRQTIVALGLAAVMPAVAVNGVRAEDTLAGWPGANAPHQERNASQHPELFTLAALRRHVAASDARAPIVRIPARQVTANDYAIFVKQGARKAAPVTTSTPVSPLPQGVGQDAPHQERSGGAQS